MKSLKSALLVLSTLALLASCSSSGGSSSSKSTKDDASYTGGADSSVSTNTSAFSIETDDGTYAESDGVYTISSYGTYTLSGTLVGQIFVNVDETDDGDSTVELDLSGVSISYAGNAPIYIKSADEVKIKAIKDTVNYVVDLRDLESDEVDTQGSGAIYAKTDLKLVGAGTLNVTGTYNNGIHSTKDLTIKNQTLVVSAPNTAIKGNDSVTVKEDAVITAVSTNGDALKTTNTDTSSSGKQHGTVTIEGGTINLYAAYDGISAAYDAIVQEGQDDSGNTYSPNLTIKTQTYASSYISKYSASKKSAYAGPGGGQQGGGQQPGGDQGGMDQGNTDSDEDSEKGIKAENTVQILGGTVNIASYDDAIHANYGTTFDNDSSSTGVGDVIISGGSVSITTKDDGLHADRYLRISGGTVNVSTAYEGLEGNQIYISGGDIDVYATNDGMNAGSSSGMAGLTAYIEVSGGNSFITVPSNGDVDSVDSNGSYKQTGGVVISAGPSSSMASGLDTEGTVTVNGGTLLVFGATEKTPSYGSGVTKSSLSGSYGSSKSYTVTFSSGSFSTGTFPSYNYSGATAWSTYGSLSSIK